MNTTTQNGWPVPEGFRLVSAPDDSLGNIGARLRGLIAEIDSRQRPAAGEKRLIAHELRAILEIYNASPQPPARGQVDKTAEMQGQPSDEEIDALSAEIYQALDQRGEFYDAAIWNRQFARALLERFGQPAKPEVSVPQWHCTNWVTGKYLLTSCENEAARLREQEGGAWEVTPLYVALPANSQDAQAIRDAARWRYGAEHGFPDRHRQIAPTLGEPYWVTEEFDLVGHPTPEAAIDAAMKKGGAA